MKSIFIGIKGESQSELLATLFDVALTWEDFGSKWTMSLCNGNICLYEGKQIYALNSGSDKTPFKIMTRGPSSAVRLRGGELLACCEILFSYCSLTASYPGRSPLNKLTQLRDFGSLAPKSWVIKGSAAACPDVPMVVKSLSHVRSHVFASPSDLGQKLDLPTLFQERIQGRETKTTCIMSESMENFFSLHIASTSIDYRYAEQDPVISLNSNLPKEISSLCRSLFEKTGTRFFDVDYFETTDKRLVVLEWNNAPATAIYEKKLLGNLNFSRRLAAEKMVVIITGASDTTAIATADIADHHGIPSRVLLCEDFGCRWTFASTGEALVFEVDGRLIEPASIYLRSVRVDSNSPIAEAFSALLHRLETSPCPVLGRNSLQFRNGSKPLQLSTSLRQAAQKSQCKTLRLPSSFLVKGKAALLDQVSAAIGDPIVKSMSGIRSHVVKLSETQRWDPANIQNLPVLVQEYVHGDDIRIHIAGDECFGRIVREKNAVDYRYASSRGHFESFSAPDEIIDFCRALAATEKNRFAGIDFLISENHMYCLELNPSPGWNWYYSDLEPKSHLGERLMEVLQHEKDF